MELLYPGRCPVCDDYTPFGSLICQECLPKINYVKTPKCYKCGKELQSQEEELCYDCRRKNHLFIQGRALFDYHCMAASLYRFKYAHRQEYAAFYADQIAEYLGEIIRSWNCEALVPVPIHATRMYTRGYNQAERLASEIGRRLSIPVEKDLLKRVRATTAQKELDDTERQINLKNAFKIGKDSVKLKSAIIIDDIYTTGSTIDACTQVLITAGVKRVYFITLAIGKGL